MTANRIIHHIFSQPDLRHVDQSELERLVETYPYFAAARLLLAQKQYSYQQDLTAPVMKQAQLYSSSPQHLYQFLTEPLQAPQANPIIEEIEEPLETVLLEEPVEEMVPEAKVEEPVQEEIPEVAQDAPVEEAAPEAEEVVPEAKAEEPVEEETPEESIQEAIPEAKAEEPVLETTTITATTAIENSIPPVKEETIVDAWQQENLAIPPVIADEVTIVEEWQEQDLNKEPDAISQKVQEEWHDEIIAVDYAPINEIKAIDDVIGEGKDEIVAVDYEAINEAKAIDDIIGEGKDEIVAMDYEAINEEIAVDEIIGEGKDEIVAVDYEAINEEIAVDEIIGEGKDEIVAVDYEAMKEDEAPVSAYEPEIEEEEIVVPIDAEPVAAGITLPPAPEQETGSENNEDGPIRIHPIDTPLEETILTFQPLYTEDYFAYKKLKDPNNAETMTDKAQAEMMSFTDWLRELKDNFSAGQSIRNRYQQQMHKLYEDEEPEVSEVVEKMAMDSITLTNDIVSETLAEIWARQHQHEKAIAIYEKLSLLNPDKNAYFAQKIQELQLLTDNNK